MRLKLFQSDRSSAEISYYNPEKNNIVRQNDLKLDELTEAIRQANSFKNSHCKFIPNPINVTISGPQNPNLTLIDFPGVVANDDRKVIMDMIKPVISKDTSIILAVSRLVYNIQTFLLFVNDEIIYDKSIVCYYHL